MYVIGTAGHVDHGKSTLIESLTGIDPDRLNEEKIRGMTIDLGFAWMNLPDGNEISIVDVPGHERFVSNMLAGVGGIDLALLVVAADESVMPQTREHLAILDLLQITRGLVVITKKDLVDEDWIDLVESEIEDLLKGTSLQNAPILAVSVITGEGIQELRASIGNLVNTAKLKKNLGRPRLPIDRSFTMPGFGTVVTGTLIDGILNVGQEIELVLSSLKGRIRGLQTHKTKLQEAKPGTRVAANLTGIDHQEVFRGDVIAEPSWLYSTTAVDIRLRVLQNIPKPLRHNMFVSVHSGSSQVIGRLRLLEVPAAEPGQIVWAQLKLNSPVAVVKGDCVVIRSNLITLGGGEIIDPFGRRHRRNHLPVIERLDSIQEGSSKEILRNTIALAEPSEFQILVNRANMDPATATEDLKVLIEEGLVLAVGQRSIEPGVFFYTANGWEDVVQRVKIFLKDYHVQYPLRKGAPREELRNRINLSLQLFPNVLDMLLNDSVLIVNGKSVSAPHHVPAPTLSQQAYIEKYLQNLESDPFSPPTDKEIDPELLALLEDEKQVVRVSDSVVFLTSAYNQMVERITEYISKNDEITVADVRDMFGASRKYAIPLMDYLDHQRVTRRVGDARVLR